MRLISRNPPFPAGGYPYYDPRTGIRYNGLEGTFDDITRKIQADRKRNVRLYPPDEQQGKFLDLVFIGKQLDGYQCARLGNNPRWCTDGNGQVINRNYSLGSLSEKICPDCKIQLNEKVCPTCGGRRVTGYVCPKCGRTFSL